MELTPRILKESKRQAVIFANKIRVYYQRKQLASWDDLEAKFKITVPPHFKEQPFTYSNVCSGVASFCSYWEMSYEQRLSVAVTTAPEKKIVVAKNVSTFGDATMQPEQEGCFRSIYDALFKNHTEHAALQDGYTGSGKTYIACAVIAQAIKDGILDTPDAQWRLHPFIIFCPKAVAESWRRVLEQFGLGSYLKRRQILVFSDSDFSTDFGRNYVDEHEELYGGNVVKWNPIYVPLFAVVDEYHRYVNPKSWRTKCIQALAESKSHKAFLAMSATPMEKVNDAYLFTILANKTFQGVKVDKDSFNYFARLIDSKPDKPNREALKRLRNVLSSNIFSIPYVKPKHKAINVVELVDFDSDKAKQIYESAHERLKEVRRKLGKRTLSGRFEECLALNTFRKTVEPLRAPYLARRAADNYYSGQFATAIGTAFKETITNVAFDLVDKFNVPRNKISIVWGGRKEFKREELLSQEELDNIFKNPNPMAALGNPLIRKRVRMTLRYLQDKEEHLENAEEQGERHSKLRELRLVGKQSDNVRQTEIDNFQDGTTRIVLFTIATGGIGLSFDRYKESLLPREGLFTPVYSGKEFQQLLGRLVRRMSISDAIQRICMMRDTVEEYHVAPILDNKLKCIAEITNRNFDMVELLSKDEPHGSYKVRDVSVAEQDASVDNTVVADFVNEKEEEDDEEEDNNLLEGMS